MPVVAGRLARGLSAAGIDTVVVDPFLDAPALMQLRESDRTRIKVVPFPIPVEFRTFLRQPLHRRLSLGLSALPIILRLAELLRQNAPAIVVYNLPKSAVLALPAAALSLCPTLFYCHGVQFQTDIGQLYKLILRLSSHVIAVSRGTMDQAAIAGVPHEKMSVVYNGVDQSYFAAGVKGKLRAELGLTQQDFVLCYVGNLVRRKGADVLVRAFIKFIRNHHAHAHLIIAGADVKEEDGRYVEAFKNEIAEAKIQNLVHFLGFRQDVPDLLADTDMFVMSSRMESFGLSIVEAMAASLPLIATSSGSIAEVVEDGVSGILVPPCEVERLADAMYGLYMDSDRRKRLGHNARLRATRFSIDQQVQGAAEVVRTLCRKN